MGRSSALSVVRWVWLAVVAVSMPVAQAGYDTLWNNGASSNRVDIVFMGDGYTASQIGTTYVTHIQSMLNHMFNNRLSDPFPRYKNFFNVHKANVISNQSGADVPPLGIYKDTALGSKYYYDGTTDRLLYVDYSLAAKAMSNNLAGAPFTSEMSLITVNDTRYGGGGGSYAVYAGGNSSSTEIAMHELGHSFSGLADEYVSYSGPYTGGEPYQANVTRSATGDKWSQWTGYRDPDHPEMGAIGAYQGGYYYPSGVYRPSYNSKMRELYRPFDAVSREKIILDIYKFVNPLDAWMTNSQPLTDPDQLWVDVIDPNVIQVEWLVDGVKVDGAAGETFNLLNYGLGAGNHTVTAHAFDPTDWVRRNREQLMQDISWNVMLAVPEPATLALLGLAAAVLLRRRRAA